MISPLGCRLIAHPAVGGCCRIEYFYQCIRLAMRLRSPILIISKQRLVYPIIACKAHLHTHLLFPLDGRMIATVSWNWKPDPQLVQAAFSRQREVDPFGHWLHAVLGGLWCFLVCGPVSVMELGWIPLAVCFLIRFPRHWCTHRPLSQTTVPWLILAWTLWQAASIQWSLDRRTGFEEWGVLRFAIPALLLWPVLDRRPWLIAGVAMGLLAANSAQAVHAVGTWLDIPSIRFDRFPGRNSGWWQPVVGGTMLTAGVGLHLPAALTGRGKWRLMGIFGLIASISGVAATGSRGAWIATAALLLFGCAWFVRRLVGRGLSWGHLPLILAMVVVIGAAGYKTLWPGMRARALEGVQEIRQIVESGDYTTYTGARIVMARWGLRAFQSQPVWGVGAGSFRPWVSREMAKEAESPGQNPVHAHSHNTFLHVALTTGVIGLVLFTGIVVLSVRGAFWPNGGGEVTGYEAGPAFALVGMLLVTPFDVVNVNAQTAGMWWIMVVLCIWGRPNVIRGVPSNEIGQGAKAGE
jgi:O-antigen ligase